MTKSTILNSVEEVLEDFRAGKIVIVVDDEDRENEGDFIVAAEKITPEIVNFMLKEGRGLLCVPITEERCAELELNMMESNNTSLLGTPFTVTVDMLGEGCTTGVSIYDRTKTIQALADPATKPSDLGRPGHINPLRARQKGVLRRPGHTEAAVDLARLAGLYPAGALIEIMNEDGTMARMPQLIDTARKFDLKIVSIADIISYRLRQESIIDAGEEADMPTQWGHFQIRAFRQKSNGIEHMAIIKGSWNEDEPVLVRVHSSCATGDILGSCRCDCGAQLHAAMEMIEKEGKGAVVYLNQEGRGIGLFNKIKAYKLQEEGLDTVDANLQLGFRADERDYGVGASIIRELGIKHMRLMTNNPLKRAGLEGYGLRIDEIVPIVIGPNKYNLHYLETKEDRMDHKLGLHKQLMKIGHIALWTEHLEELRDFYVCNFGGKSNAKYVNATKGFESYFITFDDGCKLELMRRTDIKGRNSASQLGLCHLAFDCGSKEEVLTLTERLRTDGYRITGEPRTSGDGYFESVVADPDGNLVEIVYK